MLQLWGLVTKSGIPARCFMVTERDGRWAVFVRTGRAITLYERCSTDDSAFQRANEIRDVLVDMGWSEPKH
jgi:hypothetical protein